MVEGVIKGSLSRYMNEAVGQDSKENEKKGWNHFNIIDNVNTVPAQCTCMRKRCAHESSK